MVTKQRKTIVTARVIDQVLYKCILGLLQWIFVSISLHSLIFAANWASQTARKDYSNQLKKEFSYIFFYTSFSNQLQASFIIITCRFENAINRFEISFIEITRKYQDVSLLNNLNRKYFFNIMCNSILLTCMRAMPMPTPPRIIALLSIADCSLFMQPSLYIELIEFESHLVWEASSLQQESGAVLTGKLAYWCQSVKLFIPQHCNWKYIVSN